MDNLGYLSVVYNSFIIIGFIFSIISLFISGPSGSILTITGYSCMASGLILIIGYLISNIKANNLSFLDVLNIVRVNIGPFITIAGILGYMLYLTISYKNKLELGHVSNSFAVFNTISILLICLQVSILYFAMAQPSYKNSGIIPLMYSSFIYLLSVINIIFAITLGSVLKYFSVDG